MNQRSTDPCIIVSCFEAFDGRSQNRSQELARQLLKKWEQKQAAPALHVVELPVVFERAAQQLIEFVEEKKPNVKFVISLGECPDPEWRLETRAQNLRQTLAGRTDNAGNSFDDAKIILERAPEFLQLSSQVIELAEKSQLKWRWKKSESAGLYVCNDLAFLTQSKLGELGIPYTFIHVPHLEVPDAPSTELLCQDLVRICQNL